MLIRRCMVVMQRANGYVLCLQVEMAIDGMVDDWKAKLENGMSPAFKKHKYNGDIFGTRASSGYGAGMIYLSRMTKPELSSEKPKLEPTVEDEEIIEDVSQHTNTDRYLRLASAPFIRQCCFYFIIDCKWCLPCP